MATTTEKQSQSTDDLVYRILKTLRGSFLLSIVAIGVALLGVAVLFELSSMTAFSITRQDDIIAGMLGVFAISAIIGGGSFYALLTFLHRRSKSTDEE